MISLHTQYYDGALLIMPVLLVLDWIRRSGQNVSAGLRLALIVLFVGYYPLHFLPIWIEAFRFQPVFLAPVMILCWAVNQISRRTRLEMLPPGQQ